MRRPGAVLGLLALACLLWSGVALGLATAAAAGSCPGGGPCVIITVVDGADVVTSKVFGPDDLSRDVGEADYQVRTSVTDATVERTPEDTSSLRSLVAAIPLPGGGVVDPDAVSYAEVYNRGVPYGLDRGELGDAGANGFVDSLMPSVYGIGSNDAIGYIRPLRAGDPHDLNGLTGFFQTPAKGALEVTVNLSGRLLHPQIQVDPDVTSVPANSGLDFSVAFDTDPATALSYAWSFGDGQTSTAAAPSHAWTACGRYSVVVSVTGADGSRGRSSPLVLTVTAPAGQTDCKASPTSDTTTPTGPTDGGSTGGPLGPVQTNSPTSGPTRTGSPQPGSGVSAADQTDQADQADQTDQASGAEATGAIASPSTEPSALPEDQITGVLLAGLPSTPTQTDAAVGDHALEASSAESPVGLGVLTPLLLAGLFAAGAAGEWWRGRIAPVRSRAQ